MLRTVVSLKEQEIGFSVGDSCFHKGIKERTISVDKSCFHKGIYSTVYDKTFGEKVSFFY